MSHINIIYNRNLYKVPHLLYYRLYSGSASCAGYENVKLSRYQQTQEEVRTTTVFVANLIMTIIAAEKKRFFFRKITKY